MVDSVQLPSGIFIATDMAYLRWIWNVWWLEEKQNVFESAN